MPQLRIKKSDVVINELPMESLKSAVAFVKSIEDIHGHSYEYVTENTEKKIENTVLIPK